MDMYIYIHIYVCMYIYISPSKTIYGYNIGIKQPERLVESAKKNHLLWFRASHRVTPSGS